MTVLLADLSDTAVCHHPNHDLARSHQGSAALQDSGYFALRRVSCQVHRGCVTLAGRVPTYFLKQLAQTLVQRHLQPQQLLNEIEVA